MEDYINMRYKSNSFSIFLFFSLYLILPSYFAIELSPSLPLITVSRIVLLICFFNIVRTDYGKMKIPYFTWNIKWYFILIFLVNVLHIYDTGVTAINQCIVIFIEQFLVFWIIIYLIDNRYKFYLALEILLGSSAVVAIISIIGFIFNTNFFYLLKTVNRVMTQAGITDIGYRNGLLRIEAGFGHPVYYAMYCSIMIFIALHMFNHNRGKNRGKNFIYLFLNIVALLLTNSRGAILAVFVTFFISFFINGQKERRKYLKVILFIILIAIIILIFSENIRLYVISIIQSLYVYFGFSSNISANFGANTSFFNDRLMQFTGIIWTFKQAPWIGFGANANGQGLIKYYYSGVWYTANSFDVGYVEIICSYGSMGLVAFLSLWKEIRNKLKMLSHSDDIIMLKNIFIVYFLCMFSVVNIDKVFWIIFGLLVAYSNVIQTENETL